MQLFLIGILLLLTLNSSMRFISSLFRWQPALAFSGVLQTSETDLLIFATHQLWQTHFLPRWLARGPRSAVSGAAAALRPRPERVWRPRALKEGREDLGFCF